MDIPIRVVYCQLSIVPFTDEKRLFWKAVDEFPIPFLFQKGKNLNLLYGLNGSLGDGIEGSDGFHLIAKEFDSVGIFHLEGE